MSTQQNEIPSSLAQLLIELSQDVDKKEQFRKSPSSFLENGNFNAKEIEALLSRDPHSVRSAFGLSLGQAGLDEHENFIREIVRDEIKKAGIRPPKKKKPAPKKKPAKKKK
jgi:hypothetical protein